MSSSAFTGTTDDVKRNEAQQRLFQNIGNETTRPRSIEIAVRSEAALYDRMGRRLDKEYQSKLDILVNKLSAKPDGFELNRRLLCGELAPERWLEEEVPQKRPELVKASANNTSASNSAPAPLPINTTTTNNNEQKSNNNNNNNNDENKTANNNNNNNNNNNDADDASSKSSPNSSNNADRKGLKSSYYFFNSTPAEQAAQYRPKPIEQVGKVEVAVPAGSSAWNSGGTWEERDLSKQAQQRLKEFLQGITAPELAGGSVKIADQDWKVHGDASAVYTRGKKKVGFELSAKTTYSGEYRGQRVTGNIDIPVIDDTDGPTGDYDVNITSNNNNEAGEVIRRNLMKTTEEMKTRIKNFITELQAP